MDEAMGMEVEISRNSLNCSRDWLVAMVADNSHVGSPRQEGARAKQRAFRLVLSLPVPQPEDAKLSDNAKESARFGIWNTSK